MATRLAAILALLVFAVCLVVGGIEVGNAFATTVERALAAMGATFIVGLVLGGMGQKMLDENLQAALKESSDEKEISKDLKVTKPVNGR